MGDAVGAATANQKPPDGYYHLDRMIGSAARHGADIGLLHHLHGCLRHHRESR